jgi:hypothetical protein
MNFKIIDNFLEDHVAKRIHDVTHCSEFPWYFHDVIAHSNEEKSKDRFQFVHTLKSNKFGTTSSYYDQLCLPIIDKLKLNFKDVLRSKVNMSLYSGNNPFKSGFHVDNDGPHKVALYYINSNNGYTEFESGETIQCVKNRMVIFDGSIEHRAVKQTNNKTRIAINTNYVRSN